VRRHLVVAPAKDCPQLRIGRPGIGGAGRAQLAESVRRARHAGSATGFSQTFRLRPPSCPDSVCPSYRREVSGQLGRLSCRPSCPTGFQDGMGFHPCGRGQPAAFVEAFTQAGDDMPGLRWQGPPLWVFLRLQPTHRAKPAHPFADLVFGLAPKGEDTRRNVGWAEPLLVRRQDEICDRAERQK
jgi:hypothetical protein